jgi:gliding motility-associated protein GldL
MAGITNVIDKPGFQRFIHFAYGIGAALVIIGALFKLQHWTGAGIMLTVGMMTEFVIFIISAFEAMPKQYSWEKVYPELKAEGFPGQPKPRSSGLDLGLDTMQINTIKDGVAKLSESLKHMSSLTEVGEGSQKLAASLSNANQAVSSVAQSSAQLSGNIANTSQVIGNVMKSSSALGEAYNATAKNIADFSEQTRVGVENAKKAVSVYAEQINLLSRNVNSVNSSFELQLKNNQQYQQTYGALNKEVTDLIGDVKKSVEASGQLANQMKALTDNVSRLNMVYGNMLSAITKI